MGQAPRSRRLCLPRGLSFGCFALGLGLVVTFAALGAYLTASCALACPTDPTVCQHATQECIVAEQQGDLEWLAIGVLWSALGVALLARTRARLGHWTLRVPREETEDEGRTPSRVPLGEGRYGALGDGGGPRSARADDRHDGPAVAREGRSERPPKRS